MMVSVSMKLASTLTYIFEYIIDFKSLHSAPHTELLREWLVPQPSARIRHVL